MKKDKVGLREDKKRCNRSVSPQNVGMKGKMKIALPIHKNASKENESLNLKQQQSLKICLDLASYHKKESQELKVRNQQLSLQLKEQISDMEKLKMELIEIKSSIKGNHTSRKQCEYLKMENASLKKQNEGLKGQIAKLTNRLDELTLQNMTHKAKVNQTESVLIQAESKCSNFDCNTLTLAKQSRRQQYANKYESFSFIPSVSCLECGRKQNELQELRVKYSKELRDLQDQVSNLQRNQLALVEMQNQMSSKKECIGYLISQLNRLQQDSANILNNMAFLENRLNSMQIESPPMKNSGFDRLQCSFSKSVA